jgi:predicted DNA-binding transcriptional regulator AlpA
MQHDPDELLTARDIARLTNTSERTVERWRGTGEGPPWVRIGARRVGYERGPFQAWKAARTYPHRAAELARSHPQTQQPAL